MNKEVYREIILENFQHPYNKETVDDSKYIKVNSSNPNCIDNIDLYLLIEDDTIKDVKFNGEACAISTASTSIMIKNIIGKTLEEAKEYLYNFSYMINEAPYDESLLNEGVAFSEIYKQNNRKSCCWLPYKGLDKAFETYENK